jgi:hypothetical protein
MQVSNARTSVAGWSFSGIKRETYTTRIYLPSNLLGCFKIMKIHMKSWLVHEQTCQGKLP